MATRIVMPSFGMYTAEGTFGRWLVAAGTAVEAGEVIGEVTTEKASYELEAPASGRLHPLAQPGDPLTVEALMGWVLAEGEVADPARGVELPDDAATDQAVSPRSAAAPAAPVRATPAARRLAGERGVQLLSLTGTGPGGRIVEADVLRAATVPPSAASAGAAAAPPPGVPWRVQRRLPLTGIRGALARRLRQSVETAVPLTLTREVRAESLVAHRASLREGGAAPPWDALFVKLLADALRSQPALNAVIVGEEILVLDEVHVGFAVPVEGGLVVPVVRDADRRSLGEVAVTVRALGERARAGTLSPAELLGGTATITNLGAHGVDAFTPLLNPPQSVILGIGRIGERPVVTGGSLGVGATCLLSLTFDHRVADGVPAARLLAEIAGRMGDAGGLDAVAGAAPP